MVAGDKKKTHLLMRWVLLFAGLSCSSTGKESSTRFERGCCVNLIRVEHEDGFVLAYGIVNAVTSAAGGAVPECYDSISMVDHPLVALLHLPCSIGAFADDVCFIGLGKDIAEGALR